MYDGENLVRHFIPCYRKSDNMGGMFDIQSNRFYTNELGTSFYYPTVKNELPNEDCELEYIETTGSQYIDTEYVFENKPKIVGEIMVTSFADVDIMGNSSLKDGCFIINFRGSGLLYRYSSIDVRGIITDIKINNWYHFEFSDKVKIDGIEKGTIDSYDFTDNDQTFFIGKGRNCGYAKFKEIQMYDGDNLVRNLVPYYKKENNKVGMLDTINQVFYENKGATDDFVPGPQK